MFGPLLTTEEIMEGKTLYEVYKEYVFARLRINDFNVLTIPCSLERVSTSKDFPNYVAAVGNQRYMFIFGQSNKPENTYVRYNGDIVSHRLDGPAVIYSTGQMMWLHQGNHITSKMIQFYRENNISITNPTEEQKFLIKLCMCDVIN